jgi:hypothetical protein
VLFHPARDVANDEFPTSQRVLQGCGKAAAKTTQMGTVSTSVCVIQMDAAASSHCCQYSSTRLLRQPQKEKAEKRQQRDDDDDFTFSHPVHN